jgi:hypothetical protein
MGSRTRTVETRTATAEAAVATLKERRAIPFASPWSGLHWLLDDESLERILLSLD